MKGYDLLKGMGHIDDDLVAEALDAEVSAAPEERKGVRLSRFAGWSAARRWGTAVAAVAVLCLAGLGAFGGMGQSSKDATPAAEAPMLGVTQEGEQKNTALGSGMEIAEAARRYCSLRVRGEMTIDVAFVDGKGRLLGRCDEVKA